MWSWILKSLGSYWREQLIGLLLVALWLSINHGQRIAADFEKAKADWIIQVRLANAEMMQQRAEYERAAMDATHHTAALVAAAEKNAWRNYIAKHGLDGAAGRAGAIGLCKLPAAPIAGATEAEHTAPTDGAAAQSMAAESFVTDCATDAARLAGWQHWARELTLPIKD